MSRNSLRLRLIGMLIKLKRDSLYRNSMTLLINNVVLAAAGFIFWVIAARIYPASDIGLATTLISVTAFISIVGYMGFNNSLIRLLPSSEQKNQLISMAILIVSIVTAVAGLVFVLLSEIIVPPLAEIGSNPTLGWLIILFLVINTVNVITDSIFLAYRSAQFTLLSNCALIIVKLGLPIIMVQYGGYGLFSAHAAGVLVSMLISLLFMFMYLNFKPGFVGVRPLIVPTVRYSFSNHVLYMVQMTPVMLLPVIVASRAGTELSAYFFIPLTIANFIYLVPSIIANSMFAESAHNEERLASLIKQAAKLIFVIIAPVIIITMLMSPLILSVFGESYKEYGSLSLQVLAASAVFMAWVYIAVTILKLKFAIRSAIVTSVIGTTVILAGAYAAAPYSITYVSLAWLCGQAVMSLLYVFNVRKALRSTG